MILVRITWIYWNSLRNSTESHPENTGSQESEINKNFNQDEMTTKQQVVWMVPRLIPRIHQLLKMERSRMGALLEH